MEDTELTSVEELLKQQFQVEENKDRYRVPVSSPDDREVTRVDQLVLPDELRPKMPFTKDQYLVRDNPQLVQWERETRKFLRNLSPSHSHRITATMVYEWATGIRVGELQARGESPNGDLRRISRVLRYYFGKPYTTYILGRKVPRAYKVKPGYYIIRHRPMTLTLYAEYCEGTLRP